MATSIISYDYKPRNLGYTGTTGSVTAQFPASPRKGYIICTSRGLYHLHWTSDDSNSVKLDPISNKITSLTKTTNDIGNFSISKADVENGAPIFAYVTSPANATSQIIINPYSDAWIGRYYLNGTVQTNATINLDIIYTSLLATVTDNGNWSITISGLEWYTNVYAIRGHI